MPKTGARADRRILLGHISSAHGIRGEVVIVPYTADAEGIGAYGPLSDEAGTSRYEIKVLRRNQKGIVARIKGVVDRNAAEALRGTRLYVSRAQMPELPAGQWYHADLLGLQAVAADGTVIGVVTGVENYGGGDLLEIRPAAGGRTELIPFRDPFVPSVDLAAGRVVVDMPAEEGEDEPGRGQPEPND